MSRLTFETREAAGSCETHGDYKATEAKLSGRWIEAGCPKCIDDKQRADDIASEALRRSEAVGRLMDTSGVPKRYSNCTMASYIPVNDKAKKVHESLKRYVADFKRHRAAGTSIFMVGSVGTGKTHLGASMALEIINNHVMKAHFTTISKMIRRIRATYSFDSRESEEMALDYFTSRDLLIIDEIGIQSGSDHEHNMVFEIINERYAELKPTIILSNLGIDEIKHVLGERIIDRFRDGGAVLSFDWESYRK